MSFSDDDLETLKRSLMPSLNDIDAVIKRLEAAEHLAFAREQRLSCLTTSCDSDCKKHSRKNLEIAEAAWRKASGKDASAGKELK